jgi:y4mF family transcriptional regulator
LEQYALRFSKIYRSGKSLWTGRQIYGYFPDRENVMLRQIRSPADIGTLVRSARKEQNLRQDELAGVAGVGLRFIVDLEAGKPTAQIGKVLQVLQTLGCSVEIRAPGERRQ